MASGSDIEVFSLPGPLPHFELELSEAPFQDFTFAALSPACGVLGDDSFKIFPNHPGQGRIAIKQRSS